MITVELKKLVPTLKQVLSQDDRVVFAYLYGSTAESGTGNDVDIAVYARPGVDPHLLGADLRIALGEPTGLSPEAFDVRVVNRVAREGDVFGLLFLQCVFSANRLLVDKDPDVRADFLECYGTRYRECEGLIQEVLL